MTLAKPSKICIEPGVSSVKKLYFSSRTLVFQVHSSLNSIRVFSTFHCKPPTCPYNSILSVFGCFQVGLHIRTLQLQKKYTGSVFIEVIPGDRRDCPPFSVALFSLGFVLVISNVLEQLVWWNSKERGMRKHEAETTDSIMNDRDFFLFPCPNKLKK